MLRIDPELQFIIKATENFYRKTQLSEVSIAGLNIYKLVLIASKNNILYDITKRLLQESSLSAQLRAKLETILFRGNEELNHISNSIEQIKRNIPHYLIFKTFRGENFSRIGNDIDILINHRDLNSIKNIFLEQNFLLKDDNPTEGYISLVKKNHKKIHIQSQITWCRSNYMDENFIYRNPRKVLYNGHEINIPNREADCLIHIAHMNFEPLFMTFSELLYLFSLFPQLNLDACLQQTEKYHWQKAFLRTVNLINNFHKVLYGDICCSEIKFKKIKMKQLVFPYMFTRRHLFLNVLEKRLYVYSLRKALKVISIAFKNNAYTYTDSPERDILS